ncbi:MAG: tail assembly chaperone [Thomasclavelia sp.]
MELTIKDKIYKFKFGIGFVRYMDGKSSINQNGVQFGVGLETLVPKLMSRDTVALSDSLYIANRTENPRITADAVDDFIDDENTDVENLFEQVIEELKKSNATRLKVKDLLKDIEEQAKALKKKK